MDHPHPFRHGNWLDGELKRGWPESFPYLQRVESTFLARPSGGQLAYKFDFCHFLMSNLDPYTGLAYHWKWDGPERKLTRLLKKRKISFVTVTRHQVHYSLLANRNGKEDGR